jgi:uncharacterized protein YdeI (YjbR/CyaY-like superfamily)
MTAMKTPILSFADVVAIETYMSGEPAQSAGFWLKLSKVGAPEATISKDEAIEAALCCGWIDGQLATFDAHHFLIRMTPRRVGSRWSARNRDTAERLAREGRLRANGLEQIERAKTEGRWEAAYQSQGKAEPPSDLLAALARNAKARRFFETLDRANRYAIIYRVMDAKLPETRSRRIAQYVEMLARGETIHPAKEKKPPRNETRSRALHKKT